MSGRRATSLERDLDTVDYSNKRSVTPDYKFKWEISADDTKSEE